jgi:beta-glucosidase
MKSGAVPILGDPGQAEIELPAAITTSTSFDVFPADFTWGVSTSAYQIEGAVAADGRRPSIWDTFSHTPGAIIDGDTGDLACDHYHRWQEDLDLLSELGVGGYRFSVSWPRVLPTGTGAVNARGLDWYERLVDGLLERGIQPWLTLYHWDLPQPLEDAGGWPKRATADAFVGFTEVVARRLGDRIHTWMTLNEPWCSAFLGYQLGLHAPGRRDDALGLAAAHTLLLAHGRAVEVLRATVPTARVGIVLNPTPVQAATTSEADQAAARRADGYFNRWFLDPLFGRGYPADILEHVGQLFSQPSDADLRTIAAPIDVLGVNYYRPTIARADANAFLGWTEVASASEPVTAMDWTVRPDGLRQLLVRMHQDYPVPPIAITENGSAYTDSRPVDGRLHDPERTRYLADHIEAVGHAIAAGVPLSGYFVWSLLDNFEWAWGYGSRFGLVHVDYATQQRTIKDSGHWYRRRIAKFAA